MPQALDRRARWLVVAGLALFAGGVATTAWRSPSVFPVGSWLFWSSTGVTVGVVGLVVAAAFGAQLELPALWASAVATPGLALATAGVLGRVWFPFVPASVWVAPFVLGVAWLVLVARLAWRLPAWSRWRAAAGALPGALAGFVVILSRVPPPPATLPVAFALPAAEGSSEEAVEFACGGAQLRITPLLSFRATSRDGFWPGLSPPDVLEGAPPLAGPDARARLQVTSTENGLDLEAITHVPHTVFSHLNSFTEVRITGLTEPRIRFTLTGEASFALTPFDYPHGRPARFAYLSAMGDWVVAEASDAEKGPFRTLGRAAARRDAPLEVTLLDGTRAVCQLTWDDFLAQADVRLSPTAGEGVAVNVFQFGQPAKELSVGVLHLSLGETGIGAGRETTGHAAGVYRNRLHLRALP